MDPLVRADCPCASLITWVGKVNCAWAQRGINGGDPRLRGEEAVYAAKVRSCAIELSRARDRLVSGNLLRSLSEISERSVR
jgi:hypothetical protein